MQLGQRRPYPPPPPLPPTEGEAEQRPCGGPEEDDVVRARSHWRGRLEETIEEEEEEEASDVKMNDPAEVAAVQATVSWVNYSTAGHSVFG